MSIDGSEGTDNRRDKLACSSLEEIGRFVEDKRELVGYAVRYDEVCYRGHDLGGRCVHEVQRSDVIGFLEAVVVGEPGV